MDKPKILQINVVANYGSTGRITEDIGELVIKKCWLSFIAYGRRARKSGSNLIKVGNRLDHLYHVFLSRFFDKHGFGSKIATKRLIKKIENLNPDIIHLHNIHGYYLNVELLFDYLSMSKKPVIWTLHDCWPFTGHCSHYTATGCYKWKTQCGDCPQLNGYPLSYVDNTSYNFLKKGKIFNSVSNMTIICVSKWLEGQVRDSFLKNNDILTITNGIDLEKFKPSAYSDIQVKYNIPKKFVILCVANVWSEQKGLRDIFELSKKLTDDEIIVVVGLTESQIHSLPPNIIGVSKTQNIDELAGLYSLAGVFFNPSIEETFGLVTVESMACGTPVVVYNSSASPDLVAEGTGFIVEKNAVAEVRIAINLIKSKNKVTYSDVCLRHVFKFYNKVDRYNDYINVYSKLMCHEEVN